MSAYKAASGAHISDAQARIIGETVDRLAKRKGSPITAADLVAEARRKKSPIAALFEWDRDKAFETYLLDRARYLLRSYTIVVEDVSGGSGPMTVRAAHVVTVDDEPGYLPVGTIVKDPTLVDQIADNARRELTAWSHKYANLRRLNAGFAPVFDAIDAVTTTAVKADAAE